MADSTQAAQMMFSIRQFAVDKALRLADLNGETEIEDILDDAKDILDFVLTGDAPVQTYKVVPAYSPPWSMVPASVWPTWIPKGEAGE